MAPIFTNEQRAAIARGFHDSGLTQEQYSAQQGIKPRTLRTWLQRWPRVQYEGVEQVRAIVEKAIASLGALLDSLDAEAASPPAEAKQKAVVEEPQRPGAGGGEAPEPSTPEESFSWSMT